MTARGLAPSALPTGTLPGGKKRGAKGHRVAINVLIAAAAATAPTVVLVGASASAASASSPPVCGPQVAISASNNSSSPLALTVPQYSGTGTLSSASISIQATSSFQNQFRSSTSPFAVGPGDATSAWIGEAQVLQASGPGLAALADVSPGTAWNGSPGSFTAGTAQPALPSGVAATEAVGAGGTSTGAEGADWTALGYPFVPNATAPVSASGTLNYATNQAAAVPAASLASYQGAGNVSLTAIDDDSQSSAAMMSSAWFVGGTVTTEIQACATYVVLAAALPEAPMVALIPIAAVAAGGGIFFARRRRTA